MLTEKVIQGIQLSPQQRRVWALLRESGEAAYRAQALLAIGGEPDPAVLRAALADLVERHDLLRTTFPCPPGLSVPLQSVDGGSTACLRQVRLDATSAEVDPLDLDTALDALWSEELNSPFDLSTGPLLRATLAGRAGRHWLLVGFPALLGDAAGLDNLIADLGRCYAARVKGGGLGEGAVQYADLSDWQNEMFTSEEGENGLQYWREWQRQDLSAPAAATLPFERKADAGGEFAPAAVRFRLDAPGALDRPTLLAAWMVLLRRLGAGPRVVVGTVCDGRNYAELEETPGLFSKHLPVALELSEEASFASVAAECRRLLAEVQPWQECFSWEHLGEPESRFLPFAFEHHEGAAEHAFGGLRAEVVRRRAVIDRFRLKLSCARHGAVLDAEIVFDPAAYDRLDVERLAAALQALLRSAAEQPARPAGELDVLGEAERRWLLFGLNETSESAAGGPLIHQLVEGWARDEPGRPAVVCDGTTLTYGELDARASRLAAALRRRGVGPDVAVPVVADRSADVVVAMVAVWKAGGAYVPVDPALPRERRAFLLDDLRAPVVLDGTELEDLGGEAPATPAGPENLAYVIYTSGSTGQPKGVAVEHRQLLHYLHGALARLDLPAGGSFALVSTFAADLGHTMILPALATGGCLHVVPQERLMNAEAMAAFMAGARVDCLKIVPSHLEALLTAARPADVLPRRRLVLGGEAFRAGLLDKLRGLAGECRVFNHYGPTETTVGALTFPVDPADPLPGPALDPRLATVPLGSPLPGGRAYVLDARLEPVPVWAAGELFLGGGGVARGYRGRPALTAERFVPDLHALQRGGRMYRTGDRVRRLPDGTVEFLGRVDNQVKIRGFRVEPGEVESALAAHPEVREAVVVAREQATGGPRLVAYVVPARQPAPAPEALHAFLAERLPEPMLPAAFVTLDALPLTANGKVDRRALPEPEEEVAGGPSRPLRGPAEELLAAIWSEVLERDAVGVHDDFFGLGGHSLLATRVMSRIHRAFGVELPLRHLFEAPTVAGLAERIDAALREGRSTAAPPIVPGPPAGEGEEPVPLSFNQQRLWFIDQLNPEDPSYNMFLPLRMAGPLSVWALQQALSEIVRRHHALRTAYPAVDGRPRQVVLPAGTFPLLVADLSGLPAPLRQAEVGRLGRDEARRPFDLATGPVTRGHLARLEEKEHVLLFSMHHSVCDGWSFGVLSREGAVLYNAYAEGGEGTSPPLPELPVQYADFSRWQRGWLQGEVLDGLLDYWTEKLAGAPQLLQLPTDRPRPAVPSFRGTALPFLLPLELLEQVRASCRREGMTLFMALLAAFKVQLYCYSGQEDLVVGSPFSGRNRLELEGLVGFFINTLALRTDLSGDPTFRELLGRVRAAALGAYPRQDLPFEHLVGALRLNRDLSHSPLYQVWFVLQNTPDPDETPRGLLFENADVDGGVVRHDLKLDLKETPQGLRGILYYRTELFEAATIERMAADLGLLLRHVAEHPEDRLSRIREVLAQEDRRRRSTRGRQFNQSVRDSLRQIRRQPAAPIPMQQPAGAARPEEHS